MIKIGRVQVSLEHRELLLDGKPQVLGSRAFDILALLIASKGKLVSRDEIFRSVWPNTVVEQNNIQVHISALRKAFGDERARIETDPGRGYRLLISADELRESVAVADAQTAQMPPSCNQTTSPTAAALFGRDRAVSEVFEALHAGPLVTLVGTGGIGKTQLGLAVARRVAQDDGMTVKTVSLASLIDSRFVSDIIASSLGVRRATRGDAAARMAQMLADQRMLIVLDNCEHVIGEVASICEQIIRTCPNVRVLATSREPLRIEQEFVYPVSPLDIAASSDQPADFPISPGVELFLSKMNVGQRSRDPDEADLRMITNICRRLGGIPLALEIAAARAAFLGVDVVSAELGPGFNSLAGASRTAPLRQQTLAATFDWSYQLLGIAEKTVFRRLSAFSDNFTLDAAYTVANGRHLSREEIKDAIVGLASKSLLSTGHDGLQKVYGLLETTRAYAREKLEDAGETALIFSSHARYFLAKFDVEAARWSDGSAGGMLAELRVDLDEIRSALDWCLADRAWMPLGISLAGAVIPFFCDLSLVNECCERSRQVLGLMDTVGIGTKRDKIKLLAAYAASLMFTAGPIRETRLAWSRVLTIAVKTGNHDFTAGALYSFWYCAQFGGEVGKALYFARRFLRIAEQQEDKGRSLIARRALGVSLHSCGDQDAARNTLQQMLSSYNYKIHQWKRFSFRLDYGIMAQASLARVFWTQGDTQQAKATAESAMQAAHAGNHELVQCYVLVEAILPLNLFFDDIEQAGENNRLLEQIASRFDLAIWKACARCYGLYIESLNCDSPPLIAQYRVTLSEIDALGFGTYGSVFAGQLALMLKRQGLTPDALDALTTALARCESTQDLWYVPELRRIRGELLMTSGQLDEALLSLEAALSLAREQGARMLELRVATSIARLWQREGKTSLAEKVLAPVVALFANKLGDKNVRQANELLGALQATRIVAPSYPSTHDEHSRIGSRLTSSRFAKRSASDSGNTDTRKGAFGDDLARCFALSKPPTLVTHTAESHRLAVTELRCDEPGFGFSAPVPEEDSFLIGLSMRSMRYHELWVDGRSIPVRPVIAGTTRFFDLTRNSITYMPEPFRPLLFYVPRAGLAEQAEELGIGSVGDLRYRLGEFIDDPVIRHLGHSLLPSLHAEQQSNQLFADYVLLALRSHLVLTYGSVRMVKALSRSGLAPWQERYAKELMDSCLMSGVALADVSKACGLRPTAFVRAFKKNTGLSPHQWLLQRRIHRAIELLRDGSHSFADIARLTGFSDRRTFVRTLAQKTGSNPAAWRETLLQQC